MFTLKIETDNAAFDEDAGPECARILREIAQRIEWGMIVGTARDVNGNRVGHWKLTRE